MAGEESESHCPRATRSAEFSFDGVIFDGEVGYFLTNTKDDVNNDLAADGGICLERHQRYGTGLDTFYSNLRSMVRSQRAAHRRQRRRARTAPRSTACKARATRTIDTGLRFARRTTACTTRNWTDYTYHVHEGSVGPEYNETLNKTPTLGSTPCCKTAAPAHEQRAVPPELRLRDARERRLRSGSRRRRSLVGRILGRRRAGLADVRPGDSQTIRRTKRTCGPTKVGWAIRSVRASGSTIPRRSPPATHCSTTAASRAASAAGRGPTSAFRPIPKPATCSTARHRSRSLPCSTTMRRSTAARPAGRRSPCRLARLTRYRSPSNRRPVPQIAVSLGPTEQNILVSPDWARHVLTFTVTKSGKYNLGFLVGRESSNVLIDDVYVFKGDADVFQRDFTNGTIFVNATPNPVTIQLSAVYQRIKGTQDPINNGAIGLRLDHDRRLRFGDPDPQRGEQRRPRLGNGPVGNLGFNQCLVGERSDDRRLTFRRTARQHAGNTAGRRASAHKASIWQAERRSTTGQYRPANSPVMHGCWST